MAMTNCPYCFQLIPDRSTVCPKCGKDLDVPRATIPTPRSFSRSVKTLPDGVMETDVSAFSVDYGKVILFIVAGLLSILSSFLIPFIGILILLFGILLLLLGIGLLRGLADCTCPYCETFGKLSAGSSNYRCPACRKISVYKKDDNVLRSVR